MGVRNSKKYHQFCNYSDKLFKSEKVEISKPFKIKINNKIKVFYGLDEDEALSEAHDYILKNTIIEVIK